ncbi:MAG: AAA family ATPase [Bacteriovoracaceae bacterium]|nr:AAA family ATPase [Bacteriovoracaceae bacterium]
MTQKTAEQLLRDFEVMFGNQKGGIDPQQNTLESDFYLQLYVYKTLGTTLKLTRKRCSDRILESAIKSLGLDDCDLLFETLLKKLHQYKESIKGISERKERILKDFINEFEDGLKNPYEYGNWMARLHQIHRPSYFFACEQLEKVILIKVESLVDCIMGLPEPTFFHNKILELAETFEFGQIEMDIITIFFLKNSNDIIYELLIEDRDINELEKSKNFLAHYLNLSVSEMRQHFSKNSILSRSGILEKNSKRSDINLNDAISDYLVGLSEECLTDRFFIEDKFKDNPLELDDHLIKQEDIELLKNLMKRIGGANVLLHGEPGTGKTEFAKSLAKKLGKRLYILASGDNEERRHQETFRRIALVAAENIINHENSIILIDEADALLNLEETTFFTSQNGDKAWINDFLDNTQSKIIWISNKSRRIERSTRRRFNFTLHFDDFNVQKRKKIWQTQIEINEVDFLDQNQVQKLASKFSLNAGQIALTLKDAKSFIKEELMEKENAFDTIENILSHHEDFSGSKKEDFLAIPKAYNANILNTSIPANQIVKSLRGFHKRLIEDELPEDIKNFNLLFYGAPGTGKTEFAKYLAQELGMGLVTKRASDLLSMWVGGSEKNIATSFRQAERENAILFLDEADSLFTNRQNAVRSYETSRTNQLLVEMENFKGILICSTNFKKDLDEAAARRFSQKIYFDTMLADSKVSFFQSYLDLSLESDTHIERVRKIPNITPGDFKTVRNRMIFEGLESHEEIIEALEQEVAHKEQNAKRIGLGGKA